MAKVTEKQDVKLFSDEDTIDTQEVFIDTDDPCGTWINVVHSGSEISLSLENWDKLVRLVEKAKSKL